MVTSLDLIPHLKYPNWSTAQPLVIRTSSIRVKEQDCRQMLTILMWPSNRMLEIPDNGWMQDMVDWEDMVLRCLEWVSCLCCLQPIALKQEWLTRDRSFCRTVRWDGNDPDLSPCDSGNRCDWITLSPADLFSICWRKWSQLHATDNNNNRRW